MQQTRSSIQLFVHVLGLVLVPILTFAFAIRDRVFEYPASAGGRFDEFVEHADLVGGQALLFLGAQAALVPAALAFLWLVHGRGRTLVVLGAGLYVLSALGHAAFTGSQLMLHAMVQSDDPAAMRKVFEDFDSSGWFIVIAAPGLLGLVLGTLLLAIGVLRSAELPRWIGVALIGFLVAEFALSNFGHWGTLVAAACWAVAFWWTAVITWQSRRGATAASVAA